MLPLAVPGVVLAFGYLAISLQLQAIFKDQKSLRDLVDVTGKSDDSADRRLRQPAACRMSSDRGRGPGANAGRPGACREESGRESDDPPPDHDAADRRQPHRRGAAGVRVRHARSQRLADPRPAHGYFPITRAIYDLFQRLGDGPYVASALGVWAMAVLMLTILSASSLMGKKMGAIFRV